MKYPSIPYLNYVGMAQGRGDRGLDDLRAGELLRAEVVVEEKVDGQNLGLSVREGAICAQSRGSIVSLGGRHFSGLETWLKPRAARLYPLLSPGVTVFGEWCRVQHSVHYGALPDLFLMFDVCDTATGMFWDFDDRNAFAEECGLHTVPLLGRGVFSIEEIAGFLSQSRYGDMMAEGIVVRRTIDPNATYRAKMVRASFSQSISSHWMQVGRELNRVKFAG